MVMESEAPVSGRPEACSDDTALTLTGSCNKIKAFVVKSCYKREYDDPVADYIVATYLDAAAASAHLRAARAFIDIIYEARSAAGIEYRAQKLSDEDLAKLPLYSPFDIRYDTRRHNNWYRITYDVINIEIYTGSS